jgi:hypothetical protein
MTLFPFFFLWNSFDLRAADQNLKLHQKKVIHSKEFIGPCKRLKERVTAVVYVPEYDNFTPQI